MPKHVCRWVLTFLRAIRFSREILGPRWGSQTRSLKQHYLEHNPRGAGDIRGKLYLKVESAGVFPLCDRGRVTELWGLFLVNWE